MTAVGAICGNATPALIYRFTRPDERISVSPLSSFAARSRYVRTQGIT
jgi:hypothetical protein